ncbi:TPA: hypothetical protein EYP27_00245 [Candidatus Bathyarchaeota archaeon]|nr:hypothetical protein [Candidatus Bathyarchaeota archaeon]
MTARIGGVVSMIGGGFVLEGLMLQVFSRDPSLLVIVFLNPSSLPNLIAGETFAVEMTFLVFSVAFAITVIIGGALLLQGRGLTGGSVVLTFTVLGILFGGGWGLGFLLAFIGGILGLVSREEL